MTYKFQYQTSQYISGIIGELDDFKVKAIRLGKNLVTIEKIVRNWDDIRKLEARSPDRIENINLKQGAK